MVKETFYGYAETTRDVLLIFEGCKRGLLPRVGRRLQESERRMIRSGSIFVFDEIEAGIKRWTDGRVWSPSRILGDFLVYRELEKKSNNDESRQFAGCFQDSFTFKEGGLIKKTMSIMVEGVPQHFISYYDPRYEKINTVSEIPELACLQISPEFLLTRQFRIPPSRNSRNRRVAPLDLETLLNPILY